jgi:hypothetical protein
MRGTQHLMRLDHHPDARVTANDGAATTEVAEIGHSTSTVVPKRRTRVSRP